MTTSATTASSTNKNNASNTTTSTSKCSDFSVSSLCKDLKKSPKPSEGPNSENNPAVVVGGSGSNWKIDSPLHISPGAPALNPLLGLHPSVNVPAAAANPQVPELSREMSDTPYHPFFSQAISTFMSKDIG
ncbi:hypothetical protein M8J77_011693 [Diaphorina citri]|nr:hypothetical protein M8J77_011693 [Diaphorina citri]